MKISVHFTVGGDTISRWKLSIRMAWYQAVSPCARPSVRLSECISAAVTGVLGEIYCWGFSWNYVEKIQIWLKSDTFHALYIKIWVHFTVSGDIESPLKLSLRLASYQAVRIPGEESKTVHRSQLICIWIHNAMYKHRCTRGGTNITRTWHIDIIRTLPVLLIYRPC